MKDFCAGGLKTSGFCFALDDYRALIGEEKFKVLKVNYAAFILDEDADENVAYCPGCEEPIYEEDYPMIDVTEDGKFICPICEEAFDD